ncbi:hypothetical protein HCH_05502 [Hahella chejuensis KCTC 2396]|uniref:Uncharacterized protein n=1 Tax=Hahella chejuensis (strain KCTC 2396) TaxID=349521 RepID=Q2SB10_HAHCH|nr:hypothetical protein HCH_05502 [Hahella chejuensis KCTC 2396]
MNQAFEKKKFSSRIPTIKSIAEWVERRGDQET